MTANEAFDVLGFKNADRSKLTADLVKAAYRQLALVYHPDKGGSAQAMARVNRAYRTALDSLQQRRLFRTEFDAEQLREYFRTMFGPFAICKEVHR